MLRKLIDSQIRLSYKFEGLFSRKFTMDGNQEYLRSLVPKYMQPNLKIYDIGGGKQPYLSPEKKKELNAYVIGIDIDGDELSKAPAGAYDETIVADISKYKGDESGDLIVCQAVLEHVQHVEPAFQALASILKPGGMAVIFVPSGNAVYAKLNLLLPQNLKKKILHTIFPSSKKDQGFPAYYDKCTPRDFKKMAAENNLSIAEEHYYYRSTYFTFFFPLHVLWRLWMQLFYLVCKTQAAETFTMVLKKEQK